MKRRRMWTEEDRNLLLKMKAEKIPGKQIAEHFRVSVRAVDIQYERIRHPEFKIKRELSRKYNTRPGLKGTWRPTCSVQGWPLRNEPIGLRWACKVQYYALKRGTAKSPAEDKRFKTAKETIDLRIRETLANRPEHKSLTAAFFGDPLPGRSALDQKRASS